MSWIDITDDAAFQTAALERVSRTFALTIPQLPAPLARVVGNAYLLCRIADTIEDDAGLPAPDKREHAERFIDVVAGRAEGSLFAESLSPLLAPQTPDVERELVAATPRVVAITHAFNAAQQAALERCVRVMSRGMADFQQNASRAGLPDMAAMDRYCYCVAGVVGEMLTELFCEHSPQIRAHRDRLLPLAVSFGQGLQMTNILKDLWEDHRRGACWLPRSVFTEAGIDLSAIQDDASNPRFAHALDELVGIARGHLGNALEFTLLIPREERGIRRFCLWALGMAVLTLRKVHASAGYSAGVQVKISRRSVRATVLISNAAVSRDGILRALFAGLTRTLPEPTAGVVEVGMTGVGRRG